MTERATLGFGCPNTIDPHHIAVDAAGRAGEVVITEHYGIRGGIDGLPDMEARCRLPRPAWSAIAEDVKRVFNERLRERKLSTSRWTTGRNLLERLLGKELLVLAWAIERAEPNQIPNAVRNWLGLRPEERWWLYTMTAAATGRDDDPDIGWRKALRIALTENPVSDAAQPGARRRRPAAATPSPFADLAKMPLFALD